MRDAWTALLTTLVAGVVAPTLVLTGFRWGDGWIAKLKDDRKRRMQIWRHGRQVGYDEGFEEGRKASRGVYR